MSNKVPKHQPSIKQKAVERAEAARAAQAAAERKRRRNLAILGGVVATVVVVAVITAILMSRGDDDEGAAPAMPVAEELGCLSCHTTNGGRSEGPTWQGLAGSEVPLTDGTTVVADEEYLRRSIQEPPVQVRQGFQPSMPTLVVTEAQLEELVAEIQSVGEG